MFSLFQGEVKGVFFHSSSEKPIIIKSAFYLFPDVTYYFGKKYADYTIATANDLCNFFCTKQTLL